MPLPRTTNTSRPQALGYGARLNDLLVRLVGNPEIGSPQIESIRPEATRIDTGENPEDFVSETGQVFSRTQFAGGEGLGFAHREGAARNRYWDSKRVKVDLPEPGDRHTVRLLPRTEKIRDGQDFTDEIGHLVTDGESLWVIGEDTVNSQGTLFRTDDPLAASPTWVQDDPGTDGVLGVVRYDVMQGEVYIEARDSGGDGVRRRSSSGSWDLFSNQGGSRLWGVKGRIIGTGGATTTQNELHEIRADDSSVPIMSLADGMAWRDVKDAGSHILATADDGYIYAFRSDEGADLLLEGQTNIPNEAPTFLAVFSQQVLVATRQPVPDGMIGSLWVGTLAGDGSIQDLQLVRRWGSADEAFFHTIAYMTYHGNSAFFGKMEPTDTGRVSQLWRYDFRTGGLSRYLGGPEFTTSGNGQVDSIAVVGDTVFFSVRETDGSFVLHDVWRASPSDHADDGYIVLPAADFHTALDKSWRTITVDAEASDTSTIEIWYATDLDALDDPDTGSGLWTQAGTVDSSSESQTDFELSGIESRFLVLMLRLNASTDNVTSPRVLSASITAHVVSREVTVTLPVNVSDQVELPGRRRHNVRGLGERVYQELRSLLGRSITMELYRPHELIRGTVWGVSTPVPSVDVASGETVVCNVEVRGVTVEEGS